MLDLEPFKIKLEAEKAKLEEELSHIAVINPQNKADWLPKVGDSKHDIGEGEEEREPDPGDMANRLEDLEERVSTEMTLEEQLNSVKAALLRIDEGKFGICKTEGADHEIEEARLEANPAASTCVKHT